MGGFGWVWLVACFIPNNKIVCVAVLLRFDFDYHFEKNDWTISSIFKFVASQLNFLVRPQNAILFEQNISFSIYFMDKFNYCLLAAMLQIAC